MSLPAFNLATMLTIVAISDTLVMLVIEYFVSTLAPSSLALVAALQFVLSCSMATFSVVFKCRPRWFDRTWLNATLTCFAALSIIFFLVCLFHLLGISSGETRLDYSSAYVSSMVALTVHASINAAMLYAFFLSIMMRGARVAPVVAPPDGECDPTTLVTMKDVALHTCVLEDPVKKGDQSTCCICLCPMLPGETLSELMCHHRYHTSCLEAWIAGKRKYERMRICPLRCDWRVAAS
eukprot:TRINITY_DN31961_c0_g1_i1.p1 TRINITY_DN31961_c0_g1~~TRINITY_DN31961_c0_g1_i1.p1  ORF type:complete len:237 (-),score=15.11 TRINITY_DN31961_c0_g1_i1:60-770(-)